MEECEIIQEQSVENIREKPAKGPLFLYGLNYLAWKLFWQIVNFSSVDSNGIPTLDAIEFILKNTEYRLTVGEYENLIQKIALIYSLFKSQWIAEIKQAAELSRRANG